MSANERRAEIIRIMVARRQEYAGLSCGRPVLRIELSGNDDAGQHGCRSLLKLLEVTEAVSVSMTGIIHIKIFFHRIRFQFWNS